jgi:acyl dehydratase
MGTIMSGIHFKDEQALQALVSKELGDWSNSITVDQATINEFAELTGDHQWIHVDVERCASESPFGTTIAHGFLVLSLQPKMAGGADTIGNIEGYSNILNYGSDKLRFTGAVPVNSDIHQRSRIKSVQVAEHKTTLTLENHIHVVGQDERPAVIYEMMMVFL